MSGEAREIGNTRNKLVPLIEKDLVMSPKVSVVVKSYNHAPYVHQTIQSVLDQSFQDFEIVVTDDGSTDGTPDVIRQFQDPRIKLDVLPQNNGISIAMNSVLARACGEYIAILNSDDYALPGRLARQVAVLDDRLDVSALFGLPLAVDENGIECTPFNDFERPLSFTNFKRSTWLNSFFFCGNCLCAPTAMIRRSAYEDVGNYDPRLTNLQDFDMWIRMLSSGHDIFLLPEKITAFRIRSGNKNMSAPRPDSRLRHQFELVQILKKYSGMEPRLILDIFADEITQSGIKTSVRPIMLLIQMALKVHSPAYAMFALQSLFDEADTVEDFHRLRGLTGMLDIFATLALEDSKEKLTKLNGLLAAKRYF